MTLSFPNECRSYDARRNLIRFSGHDNAMEVSFLVETGALSAVDPQADDAEALYLEAFDATREQIYTIARRAYSKVRKGAYLLAATDF